MSDVSSRIAARFREGRSFLITSHVRLDGDGLGSALAIHLCLRGLGKKSAVVTPGRVPEMYRFLPGAEAVVNVEETPDAKPDVDVDTFIMVDVSDLDRVKPLSDLVSPKALKIRIDHHISGEPCADIDYCDPRACSTGELVLRLFKHAGFDITTDIATNLYTAIISDTRCFTLPNTTASCLAAAGELVRLGVNPSWVGDRVYRNYSSGQLALWGEVATTMRVEMDGKLAWSVISEEMLKRHGVHHDDTQDFADIPRMVRGVKVGLLFRESGKLVRVSLRSNKIPVLPVAQTFGGGGHPLACGCEVKAPLAEAIEMLLARVRETVKAGER